MTSFLTRTLLIVSAFGSMTYAQDKVLIETASLEKKLLSVCSECEPKEALKKARALFAAQKYNEAIETYNQIPRGTTYWLTAIEEKGWAQFRKNDFEKALAQTKTLLAPQFAELVNSEAYLLQSLSQLKMCDYKSVFETHQIFKEKQRPRILEIQKLAQSGWNESLAQLLKKPLQVPLTLEQVGDSALHLPQLFYKDLEFQKQVLRFKISEKNLRQSDKNSRLYSVADKVNGDAFRSLKKRIQELAQIETNENFKVIQKLNLVEVEAIQRVHTDMELAESNYNNKKFRKVQDNELVFMDDGRPWTDELDKFEVTAKTCAQGIRRKM